MIIYKIQKQQNYIEKKQTFSFLFLAISGKRFTNNESIYWIEKNGLINLYRMRAPIERTL